MAGINFTREPVAIINAVVTAVQMAVSAAIAFGLPWSSEQEAALIAVFVACGEIFKTLFARSKVTPVADPRL